MPKPERPSGPKLKAEFTIEDRYFNKRQDQAVQTEWVIQLMTKGRGMTPWELEFVGRMRGKLANHWRLTETEAEKLEEIYACRTPC